MFSCVSMASQELLLYGGIDSSGEVLDETLWLHGTCENVSAPYCDNFVLENITSNSTLEMPRYGHVAVNGGAGWIYVVGRFVSPGVLPERVSMISTLDFSRSDGISLKTPLALGSPRAAVVYLGVIYALNSDGNPKSSCSTQTP
jgi:hypothetical protein